MKERFATFTVYDNLKEAILRLSKQLNENAGTNNTEFVIHCRKDIKKILGKHFEILDYSYDVISDNKISEECLQDGRFSSDIWITIK